MTDNQEYFEVNGNDLTLTSFGKRIKTLEELIEDREIDLSVWQPANYECTTNEQIMKVDDEPVVIPYHRVMCKFTRIKPIVVSFPPISPIQFPEMPTPKAPKSKKARRTMLLLGDSQIGYVKTAEGLQPYHNQKILDLSIKLTRSLKPDTIFFMGDMLDLTDWNDKYFKTPDMANTTNESLQTLGLWLQAMCKAAPNAYKVYLEGNHEARMHKAVAMNLAAAYDIRQWDQIGGHAALSIPKLLTLDSLKINYVKPYPSQYWLLGNKLCIEHGEETGDVKKIARKYPYSIIRGHVHSLDYYWVTDVINGKPEYRFYGSPGTLADVSGRIPRSNSRVNWQNGAMVLDIDDDGTFNVEPVNFLNNKCFFRGRTIS